MGTLGIRNSLALVMCAEVGPLALSNASQRLVVAPVLVTMGMREVLEVGEVLVVPGMTGV